MPTQQVEIKLVITFSDPIHDLGAVLSNLRDALEHHVDHCFLAPEEEDAFTSAIHIELLGEQASPVHVRLLDLRYPPD